MKGLLLALSVISVVTALPVAAHAAYYWNGYTWVDDCDWRCQQRRDERRREEYWRERRWHEDHSYPPPPRY